MSEFKGQMFLNRIKPNVTPDRRSAWRCGLCPYRETEMGSNHEMCMLFMDDNLETEKDITGTEHAKRNRDCMEFIG
jgi:hypothetical protein